MVQESLIEYIQKLLKLGYDAGTIRATLLNAGYSPYDIDIALRIAGAPERKIGTKTKSRVNVRRKIPAITILGYYAQSSTPLRQT